MAKIKCAAICHEGVESVTCKEISEKLGVKGTPFRGIVTFQVNSKAQLARFCYLTQSTRRVIELVDVSKSLNNILEKSALPRIKGPFAVECLKANGSKSRAEKQIGSLINQKTGLSVNLKKPLTNFILYDSEKCWLGIDYSGFDHSIRDYKIFAHPASLRGDLAYMALSLAGYDSTKSLLSCFAKSGMFSIEAVHYALNRSVNFFCKEKFAFNSLFNSSSLLESVDTEQNKKNLTIKCTNADLRHLSACKKNAKIAGVHDSISFARLETSWLDIKFSEVDIIIAQPTQREIFKSEEFFKNAREALAFDGTLVMVQKKESKTSILRETAKYVVPVGNHRLYFQLFMNNSEISSHVSRI